MQETAWQVSLVLMTIIAFGFVFVAINSGKRIKEYQPLVKSAYSTRTKLFWVLVLVFFPVMIYTLFDLPYSPGHSKQDSSAEPQVIDVTGHSWYWQMSNNEVTTGTPVEINVTSADVNHGFGIYDTNMKLVAQTQAMPEYTNKIRHTFDKAGTYRILCMEYCGVAHHSMMSEIKVININEE